MDGAFGSSGPEMMDFSDSGATSFSQLTKTNSGSGVIVEYNGYGLFVDGYVKADLVADDFIF